MPWELRDYAETTFPPHSLAPGGSQTSQTWLQSHNFIKNIKTWKSLILHHSGNPVHHYMSILIDCLNISISTIILQSLFLTILYFWKTCLIFTKCVAVTSGNPVPPNVAENPHFLYPVALSAGQACSLLSHLQFHSENVSLSPEEARPCTTAAREWAAQWDLWKA